VVILRKAEAVHKHADGGNDKYGVKEPIMPVFISHRTADDKIARGVAERLEQRHSIKVYVDDIDLELQRTRRTSVITSLLVQRLNACTNLLAIVTQNTEGSWWVPFEIGVARQSPRVITTMTNLSDGSLPEYLLEWPRLRGDAAVDTFAQLYKQQRQVLSDQVLEKRASVSKQVEYVQDFQSRLMAALGQR
jgi:hypothetical protein